MNDLQIEKIVHATKIMLHETISECFAKIFR